MRHKNAIIWLQQDEEEGTADCGCRLINDEEGARFIMCKMHSAAPQLLAKTKDLLSELANAPEEWFTEESEGFDTYHIHRFIENIHRT